MTERHKVSSDLLKSLLAPLIAEWGVDEVRCAINNIVACPSDGHRLGTGVAEGKKEAARKPTAVEVVSRMNLAPDAHSTLELLAARYDAKQFLGTAGDIRQFFEDQGLAPPVVKHRSDAFRRIASVLRELSQESREALLAGHAYAGPSQLGSLSSAIRRSGASMREGTSQLITTNDSGETGKTSPDASDGKSEKSPPDTTA